MLASPSSHRSLLSPAFRPSLAFQLRPAFPSSRGPAVDPQAPPVPDAPAVEPVPAPDIAIDPDDFIEEVDIDPGFDIALAPSTPIERTLIVGDQLWAVSWVALTAHDRATLAEAARIDLNSN